MKKELEKTKIWNNRKGVDWQSLVSKKEKKLAGKFTLISFIVMPNSIKNESILFNLEHQNKRADMDSFVFAEIPFKILEVIDKNHITVDELIYLLSDCYSKSFVFESQFIEDFFQCRGNNEIESHFKPINLSKSFKVIGFFLPDLSSLDTASMDLITSLTTDGLTSLVSYSAISDISWIFFFNSSSFISLSVSANACLATEDQLTQSVLSILVFNSSGTDNVMVLILDLQNNYLYYVYTKDIFKSFGQEQLISLFKNKPKGGKNK